MAIKKALVLDNTSGLPRQIQAGETLQEIEYSSLTNGEAAPIVICAPVYVSANDTVKKAKADASGTLPCIGLVADTSIANGVAGNIQTYGILVATTGQWDAVVVGGAGGLVANSRYWVDITTAGKILSTVPATGYIQEIGIALSTTELMVSPRDPIQL